MSTIFINNLIVGIGLLVIGIFVNPIILFATKYLPYLKRLKIDKLSVLIKKTKLLLMIASIAILFVAILEFSTTASQIQSGFIIYLIIFLLFIFLLCVWYPKNSSKKSKIIYSILSVVFSALTLYPIAHFLNLTLKGNIINSENVLYNNNQILIKDDNYGVNISLDTIAHINLNEKDELVFSKRVKGFSYKDIRKGYFKLPTEEVCYVYSESVIPPFIFIRSINDFIIIINLKDENKTRELYKHLIEN